MDFSSDLNFFIRTITEVHPDIGYSIPIKEIRKIEKELKKQIKNIASKADFIKLITNYTDAIGDDHTALLANEEEKTNLNVPFFKFDLIENKIIISKFRDSDSLDIKTNISIGDEILEINNIPIQEVLTSNINKCKHSSFYFKKHNAFLGIFSSFNEKVDLLLKDIKSRTYYEEVKLYDLNKFKLPADAYEIIKTPFSYKIEKDIAIFRYKKCSDRTSYVGKERALLQLKAIGIELQDIPLLEEECFNFFESVKQHDIKKIVIDIRDNKGGNSNFNKTFYKYITKKNIKTFKTKVKISKQLIEMDPWYGKFKVGELIEQKYSDYIYPYNSKPNFTYNETIPYFKGEIFLLINNGVFSSAEWMAYEFKSNKLGKIVGEPTGGGGARPGDILNFELPFSKIKFCVSHKLFEVPVNVLNKKAVIPDYFVSQTVEDFQKQKDTLIDFVKALD